MTYQLILTPQAISHLKIWQKSGQKKILTKISKLLEELQLHPTTGTGHVEKLRGDLTGLWSREISKGDRLIYSIEDDKVIVYVISLKGHYSDK